MTVAQDTWDLMRARTWDPLAPDGPGTMEDLLGALGAARAPEGLQRAVLRSFVSSAAFIPAPPKLKEEIKAFLGEGGDGDIAG